MKYVEQYLNYLISENYSLKTVKKKKNHLKEFDYFLTKILKKENTSKNWTKDVILKYYDYLKNRKNKKSSKTNNYPYKKLSSQIVLQTIYNLKYYFDYLIENRKLVENVFDKIELPIYKKTFSDVSVSENDILKLVSVINTNTYIGFRDRVIIELMYECGLRRNEIVNLTIYDINFNENILNVRNTKGKKDRVIPLGEVIKSYLKEYMLNVRKYMLSVSGIYTDKLFLTVKGGILQSYRVSRIVSKYSKLSGVKLSAHSLRHAFAIHMLRKGCDIRYIQELLGHRFLSTTMVYTKIIDDDLKEKIKKYHPRENKLYDILELNKLKIICKK